MADAGVAAHYGDPAREQRAMTEGQVLVDRSNRGVVKVSGQDRLGWLNSLTSQLVERLAPGVTTEALILSPQGHLEHHLTLTDDGTATWIHVEPGTAKALVDFLDSMRFMMRVEVEDLSGLLVVQTVAGPLPAEGGVLSRTDSGVATSAPFLAEGEVTTVMQNPFGIDLIVSPDAAGKLAESLPVAGLWAFEAARIAAHIARPGLDTDHKTLPHEIGLIDSAVHLNKGCYRGQETVAGSTTSGTRRGGSSSSTWTARWTGCLRTARRSPWKTALRWASSGPRPGTSSSGRSVLAS